MNHFVTNIHITRLYHLEGIDIPICDEKYPHLIITGKNGSGKTVLLNTIADALQVAKNHWFPAPIRRHPGVIEFQIKKDQVQVTNKHGEITCTLYGYPKPEQEDYIIALYPADRSLQMIEPDSPQKPQVDADNIRNTSSDQFIKFLVDLKFQELLSISKNKQEKVDAIQTWFKDFEDLLKELFEDETLTLGFEQDKTYTFKITKGGQTFGFNEMSDGFKAVLNIVADLILRMQDGGVLSSAYQKEGIVLIDEIETHLHLELQKMVLPFLTRLFPNIQFIVTTHSPFVLNSIPNAVAYDLEHQEILSDLTEYSYESLAEGYFGVKTPSSYTEMQLNRLKGLLEKADWSEADKLEVKRLTTDFEKIPEAISPLIVGGYRQLAVKYANRIKEL